MSDECEKFDLLHVLNANAEHLNAIGEPQASPTIFYDILSGGLVWSDETVKSTPTQVIWTLRRIFAYRTGLILDRPRDEFKGYWKHAISLFPKWVGFRTERRQPTPELLAIYRRGEAELKKCLRDNKM
jgi:hypothetical protein